MNTQERSVLENFLNQLAQVRGVTKDREAEQLIRQAFERQPDAAYLVVQRALLVGQALEQAKARLAELEAQAESGRGFLDPAASGWESTGGQPAYGNPAAHRSAGQPASYGPAGQPYGQPAPYAQPGQYVPPVQYGAPPFAPYAAPPPTGFGGMPSFLGQAAATAAGVAGGAFLFEGIEHLFGHHGSPFVEQGPAAFPTEEVTVNNYYYPEEHQHPSESRSEEFTSYTADNVDPEIDTFSEDDPADDQDFV